MHQVLVSVINLKLQLGGGKRLAIGQSTGYEMFEGQQDG